MGSRDEILAALRKAAPPETPLPDPAHFPFEGDLVERFAKSVVEVGGRCVRLSNAELPAALAELSKGRVVSLLLGAPPLEGDPHELADVELCIVQGDLAVAENGAVWITQHGGEQRAVLFLAQHLAVVVRHDAIVPTLHEAYDRIGFRRGFSLFLSGPSKTADIEQALVIGAHGARSCTVFVIS